MATVAKPKTKVYTPKDTVATHSKVIKAMGSWDKHANDPATKDIARKNFENAIKEHRAVKDSVAKYASVPKLKKGGKASAGCAKCGKTIKKK